MNRSLSRLCILFLICLLWAGCSKRRGVVAVEVIATTDIHGMIFADDCLEGNERNGSLAKFASFISQERDNCRNLVYLDAGDNLQGSVDVYQDVTAQFYRPSLPGQALSLLGCDATVMGNHDFMVGTQSYERFFRNATFPVLCANAYFDDYGDYFPPYTIIERHGVRIAVLGLVSPAINYTIPRDLLGAFRIADAVETAGYWVPLLKEKADVVVGLVHSGFVNETSKGDAESEDVALELAQKVPGFDVIVFGHDHQSRCLKVPGAQGDSVLLINPGAHVRRAGVVTLSVDFTSGGKPSVNTKGELKDITGFEPDKSFVDALSPWHKDVSNYVDSVVGYLDHPLDAGSALWRPVDAVDYIHSIQMGYYGAEVSLTAPTMSGTQFTDKEFRIRDAFRLCKFENNMISVMMSGREIVKVLEYSAGLFYEQVPSQSGHLLKIRKSRSGYSVPQYQVNGFITAAGMDYTIDVTKPAGSRVKVLRMWNGDKFDPDRMYRTTINSYLYSGDESAVLLASGIDLKEMEKRLNASSRADIRYYVITNFWVRKDAGKAVSVDRYDNWKLVPEKVVSSYLAQDTISFRLVQ